MTMKDSIVAWAFVSTVVPFLVSSMAGCASFCRGGQKEGSCCHACKTTQKIAIIDVGGQVHEPKRIEADSDGLSLRRALMAAGGARENLVSQSSTTPDPLILNKLEKIKTLGKELGVYGFNREVFGKFPESGAQIVGKPREDIERAEQRARTEVDAVIADLSSSLSNASLKAAKNMSSAVGDAEEKMRLIPLLRQKPKNPYSFTDDALEKHAAAVVENEKRAFDALSKATYGTSSSNRTPAYMVALERTRGTLTYYFPYELVMTGLAGDIALQDGDSVQVVNVGDTSLNSSGAEPVGDQPSITVQGYASIREGAGNLSTLGLVHENCDRATDDPRSVWILVRPSASGLAKTVFVLPDKLVSPDGLAANAKTLDGDNFTYAILPQMPIVLESLLAKAINSKVQDTRECFIKRHCDRTQQESEESGSFFAKCRRRRAERVSPKE